MRLLVNSTPRDLVVTDGATVAQSGDRLLVETADGTATALAVRSGVRTYISYRGRQYTVEKAVRTRSSAAGSGDGEIRASMPGQVVQVLLQAGAEVAAGDRILVVEAMKTQQPIVAPIAGTVESVSVEVGQQVAEGQVLATIVELASDTEAQPAD